MIRPQHKHEQQKRRKSAERRGRLAEFYVKYWLIIRGYWPLHSRYKSHYGEIDLVMKRGSKILFVEVKYRANKSDFSTALPPYQADRIIRAATSWISENQYRIHIDMDYQIDVVFVSPFAIPMRIKNALTLTDSHWHAGL